MFKYGFTKQHLANSSSFFIPFKIYVPSGTNVEYWILVSFTAFTSPRDPNLLITTSKYYHFCPPINILNNQEPDHENARFLGHFIAT